MMKNVALTTVQFVKHIQTEVQDDVICGAK